MKKRIVSFLMALVMAVSLLPVSAFAAEDAPFTVLAPTGAVAEETGRTESVEWDYSDGSSTEKRTSTVNVWSVSVPKGTQKVKLQVSDTSKYNVASMIDYTSVTIKYFVNIAYPDNTTGGSWDAETKSFVIDDISDCTSGGKKPLTLSYF